MSKPLSEWIKEFRYIDPVVMDKLAELATAKEEVHARTEATLAKAMQTLREVAKQ